MLNPVVNQLITEVDGLWKLALRPPTTDKPACFGCVNQQPVVEQKPQDLQAREP